MAAAGRGPPQLLSHLQTHFSQGVMTAGPMDGREREKERVRVDRRRCRRRRCPYRFVCSLLHVLMTRLGKFVRGMKSPMLTLTLTTVVVRRSVLNARRSMLRLLMCFTGLLVARAALGSARC